MTCKGVVKGNTILLEEQAHLPEGAAVEVRILDPSEVREPTEANNKASTSATQAAIRSGEDPFEALLARRVANAGVRVNMDEIIEEEKQDREERVDHWLFPQS
jgi:hypothetical protein